MGSAVTAERYCLFDTVLGLGGIAWNEVGLTRVHLPEADAAAAGTGSSAARVFRVS